MKGFFLSFAILFVFGAVCLSLDRWLTKRVKPGYRVKIIKACEHDLTVNDRVCVLPAAPRCGSVHRLWEKAAAWVPERDIRIYKISIAENTDVGIYADIEVSRSPKMLSAAPDAQIFRYKYTGPMPRRQPPCDVEYSGSNTTASQIDFVPFGILVKKGEPVYVHMDVFNWSPVRVDGMSQDVAIYYIEE